MLIFAYQILEKIHKLKKQYLALCNILILIISIYSCDDSEIVSEEELKNYAESYIEEYKNLVDENVKPDYKKYFNFYKSYPFKINLTLSQTSGASIEFSTSDTATFVFKTVIQRIEEHIAYPNVFLYRALSPDTLLRIFRKPHVFHSKGYLYMRDLKVIEDKDRYFLEIGDSSCVLFEKITLGDKVYQFLLFTGSYNPIYWNEETVRKDVLHFFQADFENAFFRYIDFREFVIEPELIEIVKIILEKRDDDKYTFLDKENDIKEMVSICLKNGIEPGFANDVYNYLKENKDRYIEPEWYENWFVAIGGGIAVAILLGLFTLFKKKLFINPKQ